MSKVTIYTDGASRGNPGSGGWGAVILAGDEVMELGGREEKTTNNRMEMMAAIEALTPLPTSVEVVVHTDSTYLLNGITRWVYGWEQNGWKTKTKDDVLNKDLWQRLMEESGKREVEWQKVSGHSGHSYNDRCDAIATLSADGVEVKLYRGPASKYKSGENKGAGKGIGMNKSRAPAYSYVSEVDGVVEMHKTWLECKQRVEGKRARFRKAVSKEDEENIIEEFKQ